jgi:hypothetical protein
VEKPLKADACLEAVLDNGVAVGGDCFEMSDDVHAYHLLAESIITYFQQICNKKETAFYSSLFIFTDRSFY